MTTYSNGTILLSEQQHKALKALALVVCLLIVGSCSVRGVDISINWFPADPEDWEHVVEARCTNIPPGECCKPQQEVLPSLEGIGSGLTTFSSLLENQFGAGWGAVGRAHSDISDCTGLPIFRIFGPTGLFPWTTYRPPLISIDIPNGEPQEIVFSASWVDLRTRLPPSTAAIRYLQFQNVRGLFWGKNTWSANSDGIPFPKRDRTQRLNAWAPRGTAYISSPWRWRHPDLYRTNETDYTDAGDGVYKSADGRVLNLTTFEIQ